MKTKTGNTNIEFVFLTKNGVATSCRSVHEDVRQNSIKKAKKILRKCNSMHNYHCHMDVTHFLDYAEHVFLEKVTSPGGENEDKLESIKKVPETRTLKNTQKRRVHQQMPTQGFKKYPKEKNIKK